MAESALTYGTLSVKAYCNGEEIAAEVEIVNVGKYHTPFQTQLPPGTYILIANWMGQQEIKSAVVEQDKTTNVDFYFQTLSMTLAYAYLTLSVIGLIISITSLWITATKK